MAKYSTGSSGGGAGESCELCGASGVDLHSANVAGAQLEVCSDCAEHDDNAKTTSASPSSSDGQDERDRRKRAAQNTARMHDAGQGDASHWEEGADYDDDQLPYLVTDYGQRLTEARQDEGFQLSELAEELDIDEADLLAVEQGRATQANVGGSVIVTLEDFLDVELSETR
jgi:ribosome-binding protein aMBF1 (putative translation factor)